MIIDTHGYIGDSNIPQCSAALQGCSIDRVLHYADQAGVDKTIIMPNRYLDYRKANQVIADAVKQHPDRFIGFGKADPDQDPDWRETLRIAIEDLGLKGVAEIDIPNRVDKDPATHELLDRCEEYQIPLMFHCEAMESAVIEIQFAQCHPRTNVILGHMGMAMQWAAHRACIRAARELPNLYLEMSTVLTQFTLKEAGEQVPDQLLFGSDTPTVNPKGELDRVKAMGFCEETEEKIFSTNILRILDL